MNRKGWSILARLAIGVSFAATGPVWAQTVRIAAIVRDAPTPLNHARQGGSNPPQSLDSIESETTFYVEIWATNTGDPQGGLACVHVDLAYDRTDLISPVAPVQDSAYFPLGVVPVAFDDPSGSVGDIGGCQSAPPIDTLGIGEWVLVDRIEMVAEAPGGPITFTLTDADNLFAGTSIIGQLSDVDPADIDFVPQSLSVGGCTVFPFGDVNFDMQVNIFDIFCVLDGFVDVFDNCTIEATDISPCDGGDGVINIFDIFAVLDAFVENPPCDDPCLMPGR